MTLPARPSTRLRLMTGTCLTALAVGVGACGGSGEPVDWAIVESGADGQLFVIPIVEQLGACDEVKVDERKSNANQVELALSIETEGGDCPAVGIPPRPVEVELAQPLRGQQISGPRLKPPSANPAAKPGAAVPSVVGFRLPDARAILKARGIESKVTTGPTTDATEVTSQSPSSGATGASDGFTPIVSLRTVPR